MARGERSLQKHASAAAQESFSLAAGDYQAALDMSRRVHPAFQEVVMVSLGLVEAKMAHTPLEFAAAMKKLDQEDAIVGKTYDETGIHFIYTDEEQYHLDRAEAYLAAPVRIAQYPRDARRELRAAQAAITPPYPKRHQAFNLVLQAQS